MALFSSASLITPQLYLSDLWTAQNDAKLEELGITHVVSVIDGGTPPLPKSILAHRRLFIHIYDLHTADILKHLETTTAFISAAINEDPKNKVLVHCFKGISRSPTVVCAYLLATTNMTAPETIAHVRSLRSIIHPNSAFRRQLTDYGTRYVKTDPKPLEDSSTNVQTSADT